MDVFLLWANHTPYITHGSSSIKKSPHHKTIHEKENVSMNDHKWVALEMVLDKPTAGVTHANEHDLHE